ncbi:MAG: hypothetical protein FWG39_01265 [Alphaproteobacteria bacterium]|nr:hypothetical protein [Alphaproteobacteria bacterium]
MGKVEKFENLAAFYEQMKTVQAAISVIKGGIPIEGYAGRFFAADVLEMIVNGPAGAIDAARMDAYRQEFESVKEWVTPPVKPMHEMTLEEFEKVMNI